MGTSTVMRYGREMPLEAHTPFWLGSYGTSMSPLWGTGAKLLIQPADLEQLRCGDIVLYKEDDGWITHRLIGKRRVRRGWRFQAKSDLVCQTSFWYEEAAVLGKVIAYERQGDAVFLDRGPALWRQRMHGLRERLRNAVYSLYIWTRRGQSPAAQAARPTDEAHRRMNRTRAQLLSRRLVEAARQFDAAGVESVALKGMALLAEGSLDCESREIGAIDLLVREADKDKAFDVLLGMGYVLQGEAEYLRIPLRNKAVFRGPSGSRLDLHWTIINGGWRLQRAFDIDWEALWERTRRVAFSGGHIRILGLEDQVLHLSMHVMLGGGVGLNWWLDLHRLISARGDSLDWNALAGTARSWGLGHLLWLVLDVLVRYWKTPVPFAMIRAVRPVFPKRLVLRRLLPRSLSEPDGGGRVKSYLRDLIIPDSPLISVALLIRWLHPPRAWFRFAVQGSH